MKKSLFIILYIGLLSGCVQVIDNRVTPNHLYDIKNREIRGDKNTVIQAVVNTLQYASPQDAEIRTESTTTSDTITGKIYKKWGYYVVTATVTQPDFNITTVTLKIDIATGNNIPTPYPDMAFYITLLDHITRNTQIKNLP